MKELIRELLSWIAAAMKLSLVALAPLLGFVSWRLVSHNAYGPADWVEFVGGLIFVLCLGLAVLLYGAFFGE